MPFYIKRGEIPEKRHIQHKNPRGNLYFEELFSRRGFSDIYSNGYHLALPTRVSEVGDFETITLTKTKDNRLRHRHLKTFSLPPAGDFIYGRQHLAHNNETRLSTVSPIEEQTYFYRNAHADEIIFVHKGKGTLQSMFGKLEFHEGDYIVIPRSVVFQIKLSAKGHRFFIIETIGPAGPPEHFFNRFGQFLEDAPFCERDIRVPDFSPPQQEKGDFLLKIGTREGIQNVTLGHHPFDLAGWDGFYYPWIFNIKDYMPKVGKLHLPPPVHQTFGAPGLVICSFVPRLFDFHEQAIPAPYNHSNVDSDEILYYVEGDFMSRKGVEEGSITLHPMGLSHGPQPGKIESSIGKKETKEYAVMVDTFNPLILTDICDRIEDDQYPYSWK